LAPAERKRLAYLEQTTAQLYRLLNRDDHWAALAAIVDNLLAHETLEGEEVEDIMRQWLR
jgi:ATP-dependent Zn protease